MTLFPSASAVLNTSFHSIWHLKIALKFIKSTAIAGTFHSNILIHFLSINIRKYVGMGTSMRVSFFHFSFTIRLSFLYMNTSSTDCYFISITIQIGKKKLKWHSICYEFLVLLMFLIFILWLIVGRTT